MSKKRSTSYTFDASAKTIVCADFTSLEAIQLITNVTDNVIIYNFADPTKGGTLASTTLTLAFDTTSMADADKLMILVDDGATTVTVTGPLTDTQLRASAVPVSLASVPSHAVTNAGTFAVQATGTVTANAGTNLNTSALAVESGGNLAAIKAKTDNIPAQGQALAAASLPVVLPAAQITAITPPAAITGFATSAKQDTLLAELQAKADLTETQPVSLATVPTHSVTQSGTWTVQPGNTANTVAWKVDGSAVTQPVSGTVGVTGVSTAANQATIIGHVDGIETLLTTIEANQLPDGHNVTIDNPGDIGGGVQYADGASVATPTGTVAMFDDAGTMTAVSDTNPMPVSATIDTTGLATSANQQTDALTDAELRATPVPVSTGLSQGLTDTQLRATAVPVDGSGVTQPVSGTITANLGTLNGAALAANQQTDALTDTQLRATAVDVSVSAMPTTNVAQSGSWTVIADAGTDLNTSALALEAGNLATIAGAVSGTEMQVDIVSSALPTGAATAANQQNDALTDTELRATPVPVSGTVTANATLAAETTKVIGTVNIASAQTLATVTAVTAITNALPAGTNAIGKLAANDGVDIGNVDVASIAAGTNLIGDVDIAPRTTGGWSVGNFTTGDTYTALTNTAQVIKGSAGKFGGYYIYNPNTSAAYVMVYDIAAASVTVGTSTAKLVFCIPAGGGANLEIMAGIPFGTALSCAAATTGSGNTAPTTALEAMIWYK